MIMKRFAIYDSKAGAALDDWKSLNNETAMRSFHNAINDPATNFYKHPADYTLFELGTWDNVTMQTVDLEKKIPLANGLTLKEHSDLAEMRRLNQLEGTTEPSNGAGDEEFENHVAIMGGE